MSTRVTKTFIDTGISGLVNLVNHNLNGTPDIFITEVVAGNEVYVPLMDSRIAEVKNLDPNNFQITFASLFAGYIYFNVIVGDNPSDHNRLLAIEKSYTAQMLLIQSKVAHNQWVAINNLRDQQMKTLQTQIEDLKVRVAKNEVDISVL